MRGEKKKLDGWDCKLAGSHPRARGKGKEVDLLSPHYRITPACAGKSMPIGCTSPTRWDHPRVRGEKHRHAGIAGVGVGITPACAGKSARSTGLYWRM